MRTPLQIAATQGGMELVQILLQHGADVNTDVNADAGDKPGETAIQRAAGTGNIELV
jgi:ankyrin repeat protein